MPHAGGRAGESVWVCVCVCDNSPRRNLSFCCDAVRELKRRQHISWRVKDSTDVFDIKRQEERALLGEPRPGWGRGEAGGRAGRRAKCHTRRKKKNGSVVAWDTHTHTHKQERWTHRQPFPVRGKIFKKFKDSIAIAFPVFLKLHSLPSLPERHNKRVAKSALLSLGLRF